MADLLRLCGHGEHDDSSYIDPALRQSRLGRDCLGLAEERLLQEGWAGAEDIQGWRERILAELEQAAAAYYEKKRRRLSIEWTMMAGVNDTEDQAAKLAVIARRLRAHVNLIALNPTPLTTERASTDAAITRFSQDLAARGVNVTVRDTRGRDIDAACGQLRLLAGKPGLRARRPASNV